MKKIIITATLLMTFTGMGSCTNKEGDTEFDTLTPEEPSQQKTAIEIDTVSVQENALDVQKL